MTIAYFVKEKITIKDTEAVPIEIIEDIAQEIARIRDFQEEEVSICQPKFETADQRKEFCEALEELRMASGGEFHLGFDNELEWADESTEEVRMLKMTINKENGDVRFFMTRSIPA